MYNKIKYFIYYIYNKKMEYLVYSVLVALFLIGLYSNSYTLHNLIHSLFGKTIIVLCLIVLSHMYGTKMALLASVLVLLYYHYGTLEGFSSGAEEEVANTSEDDTIEEEEEGDQITKSEQENNDNSDSDEDLDSDTEEQAQSAVDNGLAQQSGKGADLLTNDPSDPSNYKQSVNADGNDSTQEQVDQPSQSTNGENVVAMPSKTVESFSLLY